MIAYIASSTKCFVSKEREEVLFRTKKTIFLKKIEKKFFLEHEEDDFVSKDREEVLFRTRRRQLVIVIRVAHSTVQELQLKFCYKIEVLKNSTIFFTKQKKEERKKKENGRNSKWSFLQTLRIFR